MEKFLLEILFEFFDRKTALKFSKRNLIPVPGKQHITSKQYARDIQKPGLFNMISEQIDLVITLAENNLPLDKFLELLLRLGQFSINTSEFTAAVYIYEKILSKTKGKRELDSYTAFSYKSLADVFSRQAVWEISFGYIRRASDIYEKENNYEGLADCENLAGTIYGDLGNLVKAQLHFEKAYSLITDKEVNKHLVSKIKMNLGIVNNIRGDIEKSLDFYKSALSDYKALNDVKRIAEMYHNLGMLYSKQGKFNNAHKEFDRSIKLSKKVGNLQTLGFSYIGKANIYAIQKEYYLGENFAEKALEVCHELNDLLSIADTYKIKGIIQRELGNFELSEQYLSTSLRLNKELKNQLNKAETEKELGFLFKETGKSGDSKNYFRKAKRYFTLIGDKEESARIKAILFSY